MSNRRLFPVLTAMSLFLFVTAPIFAMANWPFLYVSTEIWRTVHPRTSVVPTLPMDFGIPFWWSAAGFTVLCLALLEY